MDADHSVFPDARSASLPAERSAPEHSGPEALAVAATFAVATASGSACCSADCPKEQAVQFEWFSVRCLPFLLSGDPDSQDDKCAA